MRKASIEEKPERNDVAIVQSLFGCGLIWFPLAFLLVIHEYGHAWVMRRLGMRADKIVIGMAVNDDYAKAPPRDRAIAAAAGPVASVMLSLFLLLAHWIVPS